MLHSSGLLVASGLACFLLKLNSKQYFWAEFRALYGYGQICDPRGSFCFAPALLFVTASKTASTLNRYGRQPQLFPHASVPTPPATTASYAGPGWVWGTGYLKLYQRLTKARSSQGTALDPRSPTRGQRKKGGKASANSAGVADLRALCMGRSRGGLSTKIHAVTDANGLPITLKPTAGQAHDGRSADNMFGTIKAGRTLLADAADDSNRLRDHLARVGAKAVIKPIPRRVVPPLDKPYRNIPEFGQGKKVSGSGRRDRAGRRAYRPNRAWGRYTDYVKLKVPRFKVAFRTQIQLAPLRAPTEVPLVS